MSQEPSRAALPAPAHRRGWIKWVVLAGFGIALLAGSIHLRETRIADQVVGTEPASLGPVPVEVAIIEHGPIVREHELVGTIEPSERLIVAAKVGGRLERIGVDIGDAVQRGQVVARLDDAEFRQAVAEARADVGVARAHLTQAEHAAAIARRNYERVEDLARRSIVSEQERDTNEAEKLRTEARVAVARAELARARAALRAARVRRNYTEVVAHWDTGKAQRVVSARYADAGTTIAANDPLLEIVALDPVVVELDVGERDYGELRRGQTVELTSAAFPDETFAGIVARIAPVFDRTSRQARIELRVANPEGRLKPGMFAHAQTRLERLDQATIVPADALVIRNDEPAVFVVASDRRTVALHPVTVALRTDDRIAIAESIAGEVVVLGQQQLEDGSPIVIHEPHRGREAGDNNA